MLLVAIVEDNISEMKNLEDALVRYEKESGESIILYKFATADEFLYGKDIQRFDVVFMDIELGDTNGISASKELRRYDSSVFIIFVTNMAKYAILGYEVNATDYFLKPVKYEALKFRMKQIAVEKHKRCPVISITMPGIEKRLLSSEVFYIEIMNHLITYHTEKGNFDLTYGTSLKKLETELCSVGFARCSSSYLVNLLWVSEIKENICVVAGDKLPISRRLKQEFITKLSENVISR